MRLGWRRRSALLGSGNETNSSVAGCAFENRLHTRRRRAIIDNDVLPIPNALATNRTKACLKMAGIWVVNGGENGESHGQLPAQRSSEDSANCPNRPKHGALNAALVLSGPP